MVVDTHAPALKVALDLARRASSLLEAEAAARAGAEAAAARLVARHASQQQRDGDLEAREAAVAAAEAQAATRAEEDAAARAHLDVLTRSVEARAAEAARQVGRGVGAPFFLLLFRGFLAG